MVFLWPTLLWLLLAVPLLVALYAWLLHRRKQQALNYPSLGLVRAALGPGQRRRGGASGRHSGTWGRGSVGRSRPPAR